MPGLTGWTGFWTKDFTIESTEGCMDWWIVVAGLWPGYQRPTINHQLIWPLTTSHQPLTKLIRRKRHRALPWEPCPLRACARSGAP